MEKRNKIKIINILTNTPPYELYDKDPRPEINWDTENGSWVGIWGYDWPDLLGKEVLKVNGEFEYEVWQPDYRANKIYSATLKSGVIHSLLPAKLIKKGQWHSESLINKLNEKRGIKYILNLNDITSNYSILGSIIKNGKRPIVITGHGNDRMPIYRILGLKRIWKIPSIFLEEVRFRKLLGIIDVITEQHQGNINKLAKNYKGRIEKVTMGCDFTFWHPAPENFDKNPFYDHYKIRNKKVFLNASNLNSRKQLDILISSFNAIKRRDDFFLLIVGHGTPEYESYLRTLGKDLINSGLLGFQPYVRGINFRNIYWLADYFVSTAYSEGGPVSVFQAMACGLPVITTNTGASAEFLRETSSGFIIPAKPKGCWKNELEKVLNGYDVPIANISDAEHNFSWKAVAEKYVNIYENLWQEYYK